MVQKHWPVVFASVGIMPMAAFNFAISALAFNAGSHGYGAVFLISGLAVWAAPPAAVWLAIRKWVGRTTMNSPQQHPAPPKQWDQISLTKASLCCGARACCNSASCGCNCTVRPNPDDPARRRSPCRGTGAGAPWPAGWAARYPGRCRRSRTRRSRRPETGGHATRPADHGRCPCPPDPDTAGHAARPL